MLFRCIAGAALGKSTGILEARIDSGKIQGESSLHFNEQNSDDRGGRS